jgi:hypothetical protein
LIALAISTILNNESYHEHDLTADLWLLLKFGRDTIARDVLVSNHYRELSCMRFEPRIKRHKNPIGRRESRTLLMMVMLLGFVVVIASQAMKPETWAWFFDRGQTVSTEPPAADINKIPDTRVATPPTKPRIEGQFTLPRPAPKVAVAKDAPGYFAGVRPELLVEIEDNLEFNSAELAPRMNLIEVLQTNQQRDLTKASIGEVGFLQLQEQSRVYRGKLVTVVGTVRQARIVDSTVDDGVDQFFEITLEPKGGPPRPILIYCLERPTEFPIGSKLDEAVRITGFFFKKRNYQARDDRRLAPAIFAKSFRWKPKVIKQSKQVTGEHFAWMLGGATLFALLVVAVVHFRTRQLFLSRRKQDETLTMGEGEVMPSVGEQLSDLSKDESKT